MSSKRGSRVDGWSLLMLGMALGIALAWGGSGIWRALNSTAHTSNPYVAAMARLSDGQQFACPQPPNARMVCIGSVADLQGAERGILAYMVQSGFDAQVNKPNLAAFDMAFFPDGASPPLGPAGITYTLYAARTGRGTLYVMWKAPKGPVKHG